MVRLTRRGALVAFAVAGFASPAAAREPAGYIVDLQGPADGVTIDRAGRQAAVLWAPVFEGDQIVIRATDRESSATLQIGDRMVVVRGCVTPARSIDTCAPFRVPNASVGLWQQIADLVGRLVNTPPDPPDVNAQGRHDGGPRVVGLGAQATRLAAGTRPLALVVREGIAPFSVIVRQGAAVHGPFVSETKTIVTPPITLAVGPVRVEVTGADNKTTFLSLTVTASAPAIRALEGRSGPFETLLAAGALSAHPSREWTLEALSMLAAIRDTYSPAARLLDELAARAK
jgi:hypothetical protein